MDCILYCKQIPFANFSLFSPHNLGICLLSLAIQCQASRQIDAPSFKN